VMSENRKTHSIRNVILKHKNNRPTEVLKLYVMSLDIPVTAMDIYTVSGKKEARVFSA